MSQLPAFKVPCNLAGSWCVWNLERNMKVFVGFILWCMLFILSWPVALLALVLFPIVWLLLLPFRLVWAGVEGVMALFKAILFLPARLLGCR